MHVKWLSAAIKSLDDAAEYIARDNPAAASKIVITITTLANRLTKYPSLGRIGRVPETRELIVSGTPYIIIYRAKRSRIEILRVLHAARRWPADSAE